MGGRIREFTLTITTTGAAGSATGSDVTTEYVEGELLDIYVNYHASTPATADITIKQTSRSDNILVVTNSTTDALYSPRQPVHTAAGAAITNAHDRYPINGTITASLAQGDALTGACVITIRVQTL
jgi:hypothetical protein